MIVYRYSNTPSRFNQAFGLFHILIGRHRVITGMVMGDHDGDRAESDGVTEYLTRVNQRTAGRATRNDGRLAEKVTLRVEVQDNYMFLLFIYAN